MKVCVLLPTFNEAESIGEIITRIRRVNRTYVTYVVDSGSTDGTIEIARKAGARLIVLKERGKGLAIKKAFGQVDAERVVLLDSDSSYAPEEIPLLLKSLERGKCDVVVGSRFKGRIIEGAMSGVNRFGNKALTAIARLFYWKKISDVCSGFWAFRKEAYGKMDINARYFALEVNFYVECTKKNLKLCEVPITYSMRRGETKLNIFHGFEIGLYLILKRFL